MNQDLADHFWAKVDRSGGADECWPYTGPRKARGYGAYHVPRKAFRTHTQGAHRWAFYLAHGKPPGELLVCHSCDNPPCCNPAHLWLGTDADNMRDSIVKGRKVPWQKLTEDQAREIKRRASAGELQADIAASYGIHGHTVSRIKLGHRWAHL